MTIVFLVDFIRTTNGLQRLFREVKRRTKWLAFSESAERGEPLAGGDAADLRSVGHPPLFGHGASTSPFSPTHTNRYLTQDLYGVPLSIPSRRKNPKTKSDRESLIAPQIRDYVVQLCQPDLAVYHAVRKMT